MTRQQRRYEERMKKKAGKRKQSELGMKMGKMSLKDIKETTQAPPEFQRNTPEFREIWKDRIVNLSPRDIKRIDIHKFVGNGSTFPYMDDYVCELLNVEPSVPVYEEVEVLDLEPYHKNGMVNGLDDMWELSNTGWSSTREYTKNTYFHPFVIFDKDGEECSLPLDSKFLQLWDDDGNNIFEKELPHFRQKCVKHMLGGM
jgi:hypothetical protein